MQLQASPIKVIICASYILYILKRSNHFLIIFEDFIICVFVLSLLPAENPRRQILRPIPTGSDYGQQAGRIPARPVQPPTSDDRSLSNVDLLALKVDESLMTGLSQWLAKYNIQLPPTLMSRIEQLKLCPDNAKDGLARMNKCFLLFHNNE